MGKDTSLDGKMLETKAKRAKFEIDIHMYNVINAHSPLKLL